jgi:hypothetical protein
MRNDCYKGANGNKVFAGAYPYCDFCLGHLVLSVAVVVHYNYGRGKTHEISALASPLGKGSEADATDYYFRF